MYTIYITDADLLKAEQFPVAALINEAANSDIIEFAENLANGVGSGFNYSNCSFWDDLDEYDQANTPKFNGLWVSNEGGEEVIVSFDDVSYYLETLYSRLANGKYERIHELRQLITAFRAKYCTEKQHNLAGIVKKSAVEKHPKFQETQSAAFYGAERNGAKCGAPAGQAACCAITHSRYLTGGSPTGFEVQIRIRL